MNPFLHSIRNLAAKVHQKPQTTKYLFKFFSFPYKNLVLRSNIYSTFSLSPYILTVAELAEAHPHTVPEPAEGPVAEWLLSGS